MSIAWARRGPGQGIVFSLAMGLLLLSVAPAAAQYRQGELDRRAPAAVKGAAFTLLVPIYEHTTIADGGWRSDQRSQANRIGVIGSVVAPIGRSWGWRALLGGGWSNRSVDGEADPPGFDDKVGDFVVGGSVFRRNPNIGAGGISYLYNGRSTDFTDTSRRNRLGLFGELYTDAFDFGIDFGYAFGKTDALDSASTPDLDREFDGFVVDAFARWYASDRLSAVLGLALEVQNDNFSQSGATTTNFERTSVGPLMRVNWAPGFLNRGARAWLILEGSFSYLRLKGNIADGGFPQDEDRNQFGAGAVARIQLPRVASLKELFREY